MLWSLHLRRFLLIAFTWQCLRWQCSSCCRDDAAWPVCGSSAPVRLYESPGCLWVCTAPSPLPRSPWRYVPLKLKGELLVCMEIMSACTICLCVFLTLLTTNRLGIVSPLAHTTSPPSFTASGKICWTSWAMTPAGGHNKWHDDVQRYKTQLHKNAHTAKDRLNIKTLRW